jgi:putative tricarboxylic transport membrane protein
MRHIDQFSSLFWLLLGIGIAISSLRYGLGTFHEPGPGFTTFFAGSILSFLSLLLFLFSFKNRAAGDRLRELWAGLETGKVFYAVLLLGVYTLLLRPVGFLIATFLLLFLLFRIKATYRLWTIFLLSFLVTAGAYLVFEVWLQVQLPKGILG